MNAQQSSDEQNARIEYEKARSRVMTGVMKDSTELFKLYVDDPEFKRWLSDKVFERTYKKPAIL